MNSNVNEIKSDTAHYRRSPDTVMRLDRMGSFHQTRLSFMRSLLRQLKNESWAFDRAVWDIDAKGVGRAVYTAQGPRRSYSLVAFAHDLPVRSVRIVLSQKHGTQHSASLMVYQQTKTLIACKQMYHCRRPDV